MVLDTFDADNDLFIFKNTYDDPENGQPKQFKIRRTDQNAPKEFYFVHIQVKDINNQPDQEETKAYNAVQNSNIPIYPESSEVMDNLHAPNQDKVVHKPNKIKTLMRDKQRKRSKEENKDKHNSCKKFMCCSIALTSQSESCLQNRQALSYITGEFIDKCVRFPSRMSSRLYEKDFIGTIIEVIGYRYEPKLLVTFDQLMISQHRPESSVIYVSVQKAAYFKLVMYILGSTSMYSLCILPIRTLH